MTGLADIAAALGDRLGVFDLVCPACAPSKSPAGAARRVLRVWRTEPDFTTWCCARCGWTGHDRDGPSSAKVASARLAAMRAETDRREGETAAARLQSARRLWTRRRPIECAPAERYLREVRKIVGPIPATVAYLPPNDQHPPAMIAAFGVLDEPEPGVLAAPEPDRIVGVHLTRLKPDGCGKADVEPQKIMIGRSIGSPIVLAPLNDLLGLVLCEGIETGLSLRDATGLGVWAAGAASRMPALADAVPSYADCVTVVVEDDEEGRRGAVALLDRLGERGIYAEPLHLAGEVAG